MQQIANPGERKRISIFRANEAGEVTDEMMPREGIDEGVMAGLAMLAEAGVTEGVGERTRVLFSEPGEQGMSLLHAWFKGGYVLPFHSHSTDCLYYVLSGELRMGSHVLRRGDGFFIPGEQGYGYEAGPDGVEVLEFRNATRFNLVFRGNKPGRWEEIAAAYTEHEAEWRTETVPPSERGGRA